MENGQTRTPIYFLQSIRIADARLGKSHPAAHLRPFPITMDGNTLGYHPSRHRMETHPHRDALIHRQHALDDILHHLLEAIMDELKYELLAEVYGRMEAELIKSYLVAHEIDVELFQESIGKNIYPTTFDALGNVQIFVEKDKMEEALELIAELQK
jgi:hypothetical protein